MAVLKLIKYLRLSKIKEAMEIILKELIRFKL